MKKFTEPTGFALDAWGDFWGRGIWTFDEEPDGMCRITYDWRLAAEKPMLKRLSWLLKPLFSANHHWAMRQGLVSLELELRRSRCETGVPEAPRATWPHGA